MSVCKASFVFKDIQGGEYMGVQFIKKTAVTLSVSFIFLSVFLATSGALAKHRFVKGVERVSSKFGRNFILTVPTKEGLVRIKFKRSQLRIGKCRIDRQIVEGSLCMPKGLKLFSGRYLLGKRFNAALPVASASVYGGKIEIRLQGRRGRKVYLIKANLKTGRIVSMRSYPIKLLPHNFVGDMLISSKGSDNGGDVPEALPAVSSSAVGGVLEIAIEADAELFNMFGANTIPVILSEINAAQVIYQNQLGISFDIKAQNVYTDPATQPFTSNDVNTLLKQFQDSNEIDHHLDPSDVRHLFTGRDVIGNNTNQVAGFAYVGSVCGNLSFSYGLSEASNQTIAHLFFAHELGHNLGATHVPDNPPTIMSAMINTSLGTNLSFAQQSIDEITNNLSANGACLSTAALPFPSKPVVKLIKLTKKGKLIVLLNEVGPAKCSIQVELVRPDKAFFKLKKYKISKKIAKKNKLKLIAKGVKIDTAKIQTFTLRFRKQCKGFEEITSEESAGLITLQNTGKAGGGIDTYSELAFKLKKGLKKQVKKKKKKGKK